MELTLKDASRLLNTAESEIRKWIRDNGLPAMRVQGRLRFNRTELLEWATAAGMPVSPEFAAGRPGSGEGVRTVAEALRTGGIFYDVPGDSMESVMTEAVKRIRLPDGVDRDFLLHMLLARETLGSTAMGNGVAIPHPRTPIVLPVDRSEIALLFLKKPVDFSAIDQKPVSVVFILLSPTVRKHIRLLSRLAFLLHQPGMKKMLRERPSEEKILLEVEKLEKSFPASLDGEDAP
jgi:PTS system nitrogen regulatory IIA component